MQYLDPLYGQLEFGDKELKLFQTPALTRIRDISLSAVPPLASPSGMVGSRFEHSFGVAHLASLLTTKREFSEMATDLYLAALFHDTGSPPFSHITEKFLEEMTGNNHEQFAEQIIKSQENQQAIKDYGGDPDTVFELINGQLKPWSDLINGSIDLDNIDNSLRWGMAVGIFQNKFYEPEELINAYVLQNNQLGLKLHYYAQIQKWELCRRLVYDVVYSDLNLTPETMLFRSLQFAFESGDLNKEFFNLTDSQALYVLENRCNPQTQKLIKQIRSWNFFVPCAQILKVGEVSEVFKVFCFDWKQRQKIADIISDSLSIPREAVTVYAGKDRGFKKIHLPFIGSSEVTEHDPIQKLFWRIKIYLHPDYVKFKDEAQEILTSIVEIN
jgi:HD superfamily phosphohydrolase